MLINDHAPFTRTDLAVELDKNKIGNRMFFGGNLLRQPAFINHMDNYSGSIRSVSSHQGADCIMNNAIFLGTYPGLSKPMLDKMINTISQFALKH